MLKQTADGTSLHNEIRLLKACSREEAVGIALDCVQRTCNQTDGWGNYSVIAREVSKEELLEMANCIA